MKVQDGPIFIGGTGRSGTTVLLRLLSGHPGVFAFRWETQFLVAPGGLLSLALEERGFSRGHLRKFEERLRGQWWRREVRRSKSPLYEAGLSHDLTEEDLERALDDLYAEIEVSDLSDRGERNRVVASFTKRLLDPAAARAGARRWCEKTPRNILFADRIHEIFPRMRFIHILRDPRDVAASMLERGFWPMASGREFKEMAPFRGRITLEKALRYWMTVIDLGRARLAALPADSALEIRFEDLIRDTEETLRASCTFLDLEYDERLLSMDLSRHNIGRWRDELDESGQQRAAAILGSRLREAGYS